MIRSRTVLLLGIWAAVGCSPPADSRYTATALPDPKTFSYVAQYMVYRCGTLDCHGSLYRNLRVFGDEGLRYVPPGTPDGAALPSPCVPKRTTDAEIHQDYLSLIGLEPETLNAVVADHGANPGRLSLIAKPLGIEEHKGAAIFKEGDDGYVCMVSWLSGTTDTARCVSAMTPSTGTICGLSPAQSFDAGTP